MTADERQRIEGIARMAVAVQAMTDALLLQCSALLSTPGNVDAPKAPGAGEESGPGSEIPRFGKAATIPRNPEA